MPAAAPCRCAWQRRPRRGSARRRRPGRRAGRPAIAEQPGRASSSGARAPHQHPDLALQGSHALRELAAARCELESDAACRSSAEGRRGQPRCAPARRSGREPAAAGARSSSRSCRCQRRRSWMRRRSASEVVAVVGEQAQVALGAVEPRLGQIGLAQRRPSHALGIERVGLAVAARRGAGLGHQLGRHPQEALATRPAGGVPGGRETWRQSSMAMTRSLPRRRAQARSCSQPASVPATVSSSRRRPLTPSTATAVWLFICGSMPITITCGPPWSAPRPMRLGTAGGHTLVRASWPGSYQVTSAIPRRPAAEDTRTIGQPARATDALGVTPPSGPRLPEAPQGIPQGDRVTPRCAGWACRRPLRRALPIGRSNVARRTV